jgi:hypothetical protein
MNSIRQRFTPTVFSLLLACTAAFFIFRPIVAFVIHEEVDYGYHQIFIQDVLNGQPIGDFLSLVPHFLYHLLVILLYRIIPGLLLPDAIFIIALGCYVVLAAVLIGFLCQLLGRPQTYRAGGLYIVAALALMVVMPVNILTPENLYVGYIGTSAYFNPTYVVLKPLAMLLFWMITGVFIQTVTGENESRRIPVWLCAILTVACILAKPSYVICLFPALIIVAIYAYIRRKPIRWSLLIGGFIVPAGLVLGLQAITFRSTAGFMFAPLAVMNSLTRINPDAPNGLGFKFLMSILFPLVVYILYSKSAIKTAYLNLAWLTFGFGAAYMYLLAEGGDRVSHANFVWSANSTLFVLFAASVIFVIQQSRVIWSKQSENAASENVGAYRFQIPGRLIVCGYVFGLHLISGLYWYYIHITAVWMGDIIATKW